MKCLSPALNSIGYSVEYLNALFPPLPPSFHILLNVSRDSHVYPLVCNYFEHVLIKVCKLKFE